MSVLADKLRLGMTGAESLEIDYGTLGKNFTLRLALAGLEAEKSQTPHSPRPIPALTVHGAADGKANSWQPKTPETALDTCFF